MPDNLLQIYHININCTDLDRTVSFYKLIGFQISTDLRVPVADHPVEFSDIGLGPPLGLPDDLAGAAVLMSAGSDPRGTKLDIIQWNHPLHEGKQRVSMAQPGVGRIALKVKNAQAVFDDLVVAGHQPISEPTRVILGGVPLIFFCVEDPDGTVIEIMQFAIKK